jgi:uncharacterized protein
VSLLSRLVAWACSLPPAETHDIAVERDIPVPMPDGVVLLADHYAPRGGGKRPTLLVRSPYGRGSFVGLLFTRLFAERGFQVLVQSCRGTFGSGGVFDPFHHERADGLATVAWLRAQSWYSGDLCTVGPSYLGFVQWAIAAGAGPDLKAMGVQVSSSEFRSPIYGGGSFWLDTALTWTFVVTHQEERAAVASPVRAARAVRAANRHLPLAEIDRALVGREAGFLRDWLAHAEPGDPWWKPLDFSDDVGRVTAPVHLLGGWYDIFLPETLADYERLRRAGRAPHLTIGPWSHTSPGMVPVMVRESLAWLRAHALGDRSGVREAPVRVHVMGANEWRELTTWPPPESSRIRFYFGPAGRLSMSPPAASDPDHYRYDPADPTPAVGGASLSLNTGPRDNHALEARPDVLVYTTARLDRALTIMGPVTAELHVASSTDHTDFFVRLCDVAPSGRSTNLCDGLLRLSPGHPTPGADGCRRIEVSLWPTAHRFDRGHRIRVQISSGAHPRFARNPGTGEPLGTAENLTAARQTVYHDPARPSALVLPVMP